MRSNAGISRAVVLVPMTEARLLTSLRSQLGVVTESDAHVIFALEQSEMYSGWLWKLPGVLSTEFSRGDESSVRLALECGESFNRGSGTVWSDTRGNPMEVVGNGTYQFRTLSGRAVHSRAGPGHAGCTLVTVKVTDHCDAVEMHSYQLGRSHDPRFLRGNALEYKAAAAAAFQKSQCRTCFDGAHTTCLHYKA